MKFFLTSTVLPGCACGHDWGARGSLGDKQGLQHAVGVNLGEMRGLGSSRGALFYDRSAKDFFGMRCADAVVSESASFGADTCRSMEIAMTASTCRHADRPFTFTITLGKEVHDVRAHRIHPVGMVLDGSRGGHIDDYSWGRDVCDQAEGLMCEPPAIRRRHHLTATRASCRQLVGQ